MPHRSKLRSAVPAILGAAAVVVGVELGGRAILSGPRLFFVDDVDHRPAPSAAGGINSDGIRCDREAADLPAGAFRLVVLGDSFVQGWGLAPQQSPPAQLEAILRAEFPERPLNVLNFGWTSASPLLSYRQLVDIGKKYRPDLVVQCVDMGDFHNDLLYGHLLERDGIYRAIGVTPVIFYLVYKVTSRLELLHGLHERLFGLPPRKFFAAERSLEESIHHMEVLRGNLERTHAYVRGELGADFAVVVFPRHFQYSPDESPNNWERGAYEILGPHSREPFEYFRSVAAEVSYPVLPLLRDFETSPVFPKCLDADPHWTPAGARVAAEAMFRHLRAAGLLAALEEGA